MPSLNPVTGRVASPTPRAVYAPRIWRIEFTAMTQRTQGRRVRCYVKAPYNQPYAFLTDLVRAEMTWQIRRVLLDPATRAEIERYRDELRRWEDVKVDLERTFKLNFLA